MPTSSGLGFNARTEARPPSVRAMERGESTSSSVVVRKAVTDVVEIEVPEQTLVRWNLAMALMHATLVVVTFVAGNVDLMVDLYRPAFSFQLRDVPSGEPAGSAGWDLIPVYYRSGSLPLTVYTAIFFILSASFHLLNATWLRKFYLSELAQCRTPTRWVEYTLSASVMIVIIGYGLGIRDRSTLIGIGVLVASTMPYGYWVETVARPRTVTEWDAPLSSRLLPWFLGNIPQSAAWLIILLQFYDGRDPEAQEDVVPWFVYIILWAEFALFWSFGFAQLATQLLPPRDFWKGEVAFQVLSLVAKGLLGLLLISNVLMLSRFEDIYE